MLELRLHLRQWRNGGNIWSPLLQRWRTTSPVWFAGSLANQRRRNSFGKSSPTTQITVDFSGDRRAVTCVAPSWPQLLRLRPQDESFSQICNPIENPDSQLWHKTRWSNLPLPLIFGLTRTLLFLRRSQIWSATSLFLLRRWAARIRRHATAGSNRSLDIRIDLFWDAVTQIYIQQTREPLNICNSSITHFDTTKLRAYGSNFLSNLLTKADPPRFFKIKIIIKQIKLIQSA